jgi:hypothetical protein
MVFLSSKRCFETNPLYAAFKPFVEKKSRFLAGISGVQSLGTLQSFHLTPLGKGLAGGARRGADWGTRGHELRGRGGMARGVVFEPGVPRLPPRAFM